MTERRLRVDRVGWQGHGLVRVDGRVARIPGADVGEEVDVRLVEDGRGRLWGRLLRVISPSPRRAPPGCDRAGECPGCPLRHLDAEGAAAVKMESHVGALARLAGVEGLPTAHLGGPPRDGWRARARARPVLSGGRWRLGMAGHPGADGVALADCPAQTDGARALLAALEGALSDPERVAQVQVDGDLEAGQVLVVRHRGAAGEVPERGPGVAVFEAELGPRGQSRPTQRSGPAADVISVEADALRLTAPAWRPQSPLSLPALRAAVLDLLDPRPADRLLELGCGVGTLSLPVARRVAALVGVDRERAAVQDAAHNAAHLPNASFRVGLAEHAVRRLLGSGARFDLAVLHAMRRPFGPGTLSGLKALGVRRALYLAPSAAALARDLERSPLRPRRLAFLDQLPGSAHLLTLCVLE